MSEKGGIAMDKAKFYLGMGLGVAACSGLMMLAQPKKGQSAKTAVKKAKKAVENVAESVSDSLGM